MNARRNLSLGLSLGAFVIGMVLLAYASVPLYRLFCQSTGFGGVAERTALASHEMLNRTITVRFDANVNSALPWDFKPAQEQVSVKLGEQKHIRYIAHNQADVPITGTATFNISPAKAGSYFNKIQCFCFTKQTLRPHETKVMDVVFFVDTSLANDRALDDINTITLSYTFFPVDKK
jgi:cytochrome c oxidase assembly protein subunit 11